MSVLNQRISILNISLLASRQLLNMKDDKIRINKLDVYYKDCIDLKN